MGKRYRSLRSERFKRRTEFEFELEEIGGKGVDVMGRQTWRWITLRA